MFPNELTADLKEQINEICKSKFLVSSKAEIVDYVREKYADH